MSASTEHIAPTSTPAHRYTAALADSIERKWQARWESIDAYRVPNPGEPGFDPARPKFYCLDMFPYPSGAGLHVGHPEGYTATDIICRFKRMNGFAVLHPMGWDAFGLPAEQYAIQTGVHPALTTRKAIDTFRGQLKRFGFCYDWSREFATIDPDYYRWTQRIFLRIYNSWFDARSRRARPIAELVGELEAGALPARGNPDAAEYAGAGARPRPEPADWARATPAQRREIIDSYRLAYLAEVTVNWCPKLGTVLANEEVIDGRSERGGHPVLRRPLRQWMFRITSYADRLLEDLSLVDWPGSTKTMQAEWIGRSRGAYIDFACANRRIRVFTTRPDTICGATYMVLSPEHPMVEALTAEKFGSTVPDAWKGSFPGAPELIARGATPREMVAAYRAYAAARSDTDRQAGARDKTGVFIGAYAVNPVNQQRVPVFIADYVLMGYGTGAIMAVPAHDERDGQFAEQFGLPVVQVVAPPDPSTDWRGYTGEGAAVNSPPINGLPTAQAKEKIASHIESLGMGKAVTVYRLRDWLFSRQRYWGEPFPIVFDERGDHYPVSENALPVALPDLADYTPPESDDPVPLLAKATQWLNTTAGEAGVDPALLAPGTRVRREANTMPGWAGSCWYYLRYCDPKNSARFVGEEAERYWLGGGVDLYIGGAEHAVLHLLYARFWHKVLFDLGEVSSPEPFRKLFHQGLILSHAYQRADKSLAPNDQVEEVADPAGGTPRYIERATGAPVTQIVAKMSKSLRNVVNPDDVIREFGADTFRLYEMYMGPLEASKPWNTRDMVGLHRFLQRVWRNMLDEESGRITVSTAAAPDDLRRLIHRTIAGVRNDIDAISLNTAIAKLIELNNALAKLESVPAEAARALLLMLAPFAPHLAQELWSRLNEAGIDANATGAPHRTTAADLVIDHPFPVADPAMLIDNEVELPVQIAGKIRGRITVAKDAPAPQVEAAALANPDVAAFIAGRPVKKVIVVPGKLVNVVM